MSEPVHASPSGRAGCGRVSGTAAANRNRVVCLRLWAIVTVLIAGVVGIWLLGRMTRPAAEDIPAVRSSPADVEPGSEAPDDGGVTRSDGEQRDPPDTAITTLADWADHLAPVVGVPSRALRAYGAAELLLRQEAPGCHLSWATLAGIGRIESDHGRSGGGVLGADGRLSEPIIGIALDGSPGVKSIIDTDGGLLDGDRRYDRAVGPMQFIPSTWKHHGADASGDGEADPQQIDDAALSAARYLCHDGRDLATGEGWWAAVFSYNNSVDYGRTVFALTETYAELSAASAE